MHIILVIACETYIYIIHAMSKYHPPVLLEKMYNIIGKSVCEGPILYIYIHICKSVEIFLKKIFLWNIFKLFSNSTLSIKGKYELALRYISRRTHISPVCLHYPICSRTVLYHKHKRISQAYMSQWPVDKITAWTIVYKNYIFLNILTFSSQISSKQVTNVDNGW